MPLYEYRCQKCEKTFEVRQKFSDEPLQNHDGCGGAVVRLLSAPGLKFNGTGWYITDYARSGSSSKPAAKSESKTETKSETKAAAPAAKSE